MRKNHVLKSELHALQNGLPQKTNSSKMWWIDLTGGGIAGAFSRTFTAPVDRIKVQSQIQSSKVDLRKTIQYIYKKSGVTGFWYGNAVNVAKIVPETGIKFAVYDQVKKLLRNNEARSMTVLERFLAGATAGAVSQTLVYPMDVLKTRLALRRTGQYNGAFDAALKIYRTEGPQCFYRGFLPNILGIMPYAGIDLAVYETLKKKFSTKPPSYDDDTLLNEVNNDNLPSVSILIICGSTSCAIGQLVAYPLSLLKTRMQAMERPIPNSSVVSMSQMRDANRNPFNIKPRANQITMVDMFLTILKKEGIPGLYRGLIPNFIKVLPAVSITYVVYEHATRFMARTVL